MAAAAEATPVDGEVIEICRELIGIDTSNYGDDSGPGERAAAEYVATKLTEVGLEVEILESAPGRTTVVSHWEPEGCDPAIAPLLIHGHTDVVPAQAADWTHHPFVGEIADGQLWGRGAVDMKDFDAMVLSVVRARVRDGRAPRRPIRLVFFADEEAGGVLGSTYWVNQRPDLFADCSEAISEVGGFSLTVRDDLRLYLVQVAEKGLHWMRLVAEGRAGHGSMRHDHNAITELAAAVHRVGTHQWPTRLHPAQRAFLAEVEDAFGIPIDAGADIQTTLDRLGSISRMIGATMSNTVNPTRLEAGYKTNVVPAQATAQLDGRFIPGYEEEMLDTVRQLVGEQVRVETLVRSPSVEAEWGTALTEAMQVALATEDQQARAVPYLMSAGTDAKGLSSLGISCYGFAPLKLPADLDFTALFHGVDERVPLESLTFGARVLDAFLDHA